MKGFYLLATNSGVREPQLKRLKHILFLILSLAQETSKVGPVLVYQSGR